MAVEIKSIGEGSAAQAAGLLPGMRIYAIDGHAINDGLDYEFYAATKNPQVVAGFEDERRTFAVHKGEYEPLGCGFESYLIDRQHPCKNRCTFCFIDQLPKGMRPSLYFKDDDERLGFLFGNYVTLTNLTEREVARIIEMRFSPVNISVHTTNPELRVQMMKNPQAGQVLEYIPRFAAAGIGLNFQLVLVPGVNDGEELRRSIRELAAYAPATQSIAAVPVGLTRHREGLTPIEPYTPQQAAEQLDIMLGEGERLLKETGSRLVYPSDEWFLLAGRSIPDAAFYDEWPQLENGVGMWRLLHDEFTEALAQREKWPERAGADVAVGTLAAPLFEELAALLRQKAPGAVLHVHPVVNDFFGHNITVTGLLTGGDIAAQLKGRVASGRLLLSCDTLRAEGDLLLDDTTPAWLGEQLGARVQVVPRDGAALLEAILDDG